MKIKTFSASSINEIDAMVNEFESKHIVRATQTRSVVTNGNPFVVIHYYTVFYEGAKQ